MPACPLQTEISLQPTSTTESLAVYGQAPGCSFTVPFGSLLALFANKRDKTA